MQPNEHNNAVAVMTMSKAELEALLNRAAEKGAQKALADVGLDGEYAEHDIRDLRTLLRSINIAKKTAWQTFIRVVTTGVLAAMVAGIAIKLNLFGGS